MTDEKKFRPGYGHMERLTGKGLPPNVKPPPTHAVCVDCKTKKPLGEMISDNRARWRCMPCAEKLLGGEG